MANDFWQGVGGFFSDLGEAVTGTAAGIAGNIQGNAAITQATAAQIAANAAATQQAIEAERELEIKRQRTIVTILLIVFGLPIIGMALLLLILFFLLENIS